MLDIHCHIMPDVDDGSDNFDESIEMAKIAEDSGIVAIIATPHCNIPDTYRNEWDSSMHELFMSLNKALISMGRAIRIFPGQEIFAAEGFTEGLKSGELITLNNSVYPLVEFDFAEHRASVYAKLEQLVAEGYVPIVAHPERYGFMQENHDAAKELKKIGCLLQLNRGSLNGKFGRQAFYAAHEILKKEDADFVASDSHGPFVRTPILADVHEMISEMYSYDYADLLMHVNPMKVLKNKKIR